MCDVVHSRRQVVTGSGSSYSAVVDCATAKVCETDSTLSVKVSFKDMAG